MDAEAAIDIQIRFGQRLRELRRRQNWSQEELALTAGLDRTFVSSCERGRRNISLVNIQRLAAALDVQAADLLRPVAAPLLRQDEG